MIESGEEIGTLVATDPVVDLLLASIISKRAVDGSTANLARHLIRENEDALRPFLQKRVTRLLEHYLEAPIVDPRPQPSDPPAAKKAKKVKKEEEEGDGAHHLEPSSGQAHTISSGPISSFHEALSVVNKVGKCD